MKVAELADVEVLRKLAPPAAYDWGVEASNRGDVEVRAEEPQRVAARVTDDPPHDVELRSDEDVLQWTCTCDDADPSLCRHGVAAAVETWRRSPPPVV